MMPTLPILLRDILPFVNKNNKCKHVNLGVILWSHLLSLLSLESINIIFANMQRRADAIIKLENYAGPVPTYYATVRLEVRNYNINCDTVSWRLRALYQHEQCCGRRIMCEESGAVRQASEDADSSTTRTRPGAVMQVYVCKVFCVCLGLWLSEVI